MTTETSNDAKKAGSKEVPGPRSAVDQAFALPVSRLDRFVDAIGTGEAPSDREALGVAHYRRRDHAKAAEAFAALPANHAFDPRTQPLRLRLATSKDDTDATLHIARTILNADPVNVEALRIAGRILNAASAFDRADRYWRQLVDLDPRDKEAALQVARIAARRGAWDTVAFYAPLAHRAQPASVEPARLLLDAALKTPSADAETARRRLALTAAIAAAIDSPETAELAMQARAMLGEAAAASAWRDLHVADPRRAASLLDRLIRSDTVPAGALEPLLAAGAVAGVLTSATRRLHEHRHGLALADALAAEVAGLTLDAAAAWRRLAEISPNDSEAAAGLARTAAATNAAPST